MIGTAPLPRAESAGEAAIEVGAATGVVPAASPHDEARAAVARAGTLRQDVTIEIVSAHLASEIRGLLIADFLLAFLTSLWLWAEGEPGVRQTETETEIETVKETGKGIEIVPSRTIYPIYIALALPGESQHRRVGATRTDRVLGPARLIAVMTDII